MEKGEKSLNYGEAALIIGVSEGTLRNWLSDPTKPQPPCRKIGRRVIFFESELYQWIANQPHVKTPLAATKHKGQTIKLTFTGEEWNKVELALLEKDLDKGAAADFCKKIILDAVGGNPEFSEGLDHANKN